MAMQQCYCSRSGRMAQLVVLLAQKPAAQKLAEALNVAWRVQMPVEH